MQEHLGEIATALVVPSIVAIAKLFIDHAVQKSVVKGLQDELNELKVNVKEENKAHLDAINRRFDKLDILIEKLWTYDRDNAKGK
jgi:uncharacterized coiled-coil protein SlyX